MKVTKQDIIRNRVINVANYIIKNGCTVRGASKKFGCSKSTIQKDITERLKKIDYNLYGRVRKVTEKNIRERSFRGGESTKRLYQGIRYRK
ncbi:sporulation transcriptional regulator SpoIIID [Clostridium rectalis]|uniref:sporulation transcriptional regulator SpoIIID n=1 Tax=Clostridium rectalis TaxID=2040295 RepID=UPI000F6412AC|nr:sporulation transcriptional regulator SpoIIID [Clostridium rectalis]